MPFRLKTSLATGSLALVAALALSGCTADRYGYGPGGGFGYGPPPPPVAGPYYGWSGDYYYPGNGRFVYGRDGRARRWNRAERRYWRERRVRRGPHRDHWEGYGYRRR